MKERLRETFRYFFIIVTLINLVMYILGLIFKPTQQFGYEAYIYPIIYALIGSIPNLLVPKKRVKTVKQTVIREFFMMILCIAMLLTFMFAGKPLTKELIIMASSVALSIIVIFVLVDIIVWILDSKTAKSLTNDLKAFQEAMKEE